MKVPWRLFQLAIIGCLMLSGWVGCQSRPTVTAPAPARAAGWSRHTLGGGGGQTGIAIDPTNTQVVYVTTDNGGLVKSVDGGQHWFSINNNLGNRSLGTVVLDPLNPQVVYVTAQVYSRQPSWSKDPVTGELYRSRDGGQIWEVVYAEGMVAGARSFGIAQWPSTRNLLIPFDPRQPQRFDRDGDGLSDVIYVGGWDGDDASDDWRGGFWQSTDTGQTFRQLALNDKSIWVLRQSPDDPTMLYAGTYNAGLYVSRDGGLTWASWLDRLPIPMVSDIAVMPKSSMLYVATNAFYSSYQDQDWHSRRGLFKSTDGGLHFDQVNVGLEATSLDFTVLLLDNRDPSGQTLYTGPWSGDARGIYKTTDGGLSWTRMAYQTVNNPTWFGDFDNLWAMAQAPDGTLFATSWRGIYRHDTESNVWNLLVTGLGNIQVRCVAYTPGDANTIYLGMADSTPWKSLDGGLSWINIGQGFTTWRGTGASASNFASASTNPQVVYATAIDSSDQYAGMLYRSDDGGRHWQRIVAGLPAPAAGKPEWQATAVAVSAHDPQTAYVAVEMRQGGGRIYTTTDGGRSWEQIFDFPETPTALAVSATLPEALALVTQRGVVYLGTDGGRRWHSSSLDKRLLYAVDIFPTDPNRLLVGANIDGAYLTTDGGQTWQNVFGQAELSPLVGDLALSPFARERYWPTIRAVKFDPRDPNTFFLGHNPSPWAGLGILQSSDAGQSWRVLGDANFQMRSVTSLDVDAATGDLAVGAWEVYTYHAGHP